MTFSDILDEIAAQAGDDSSTYRAQMRRWLNLTRSFIADEGAWRSAFEADATFSTSALTTDGLYTLSGYEHIVGSYMRNETNDDVIRMQGFESLQNADPEKNTTGPPTMFADAGADSNGVRQIYLWPIPEATYVIRFAGLKQLTDITEGQESLSTDPYYGPIAPWQAAFYAGMKYFQAEDNDESELQPDRKLMAFQKRLAARRRHNNVAPRSRMSAAPVRQPNTPGYGGRFDPSQYER